MNCDARPASGRAWRASRISTRPHARRSPTRSAGPSACSRGDGRKRSRSGTGRYAAGLCGTRGKKTNPCVVVRPSGLIAVEADSPGDLAALDALGLPATLSVQSSAPGKQHRYFRPPAEAEILPLVSFRFESGVVTGDHERPLPPLLPPSVHPSGTGYEFVPGHGPGEASIATTITLEQYEHLRGLAREDEAGERERVAGDTDQRRSRRDDGASETTDSPARPGRTGSRSRR